MSPDAEADPKHMRRALRLAERGRGRTAPNPVVGAVLVRRGMVVGEGWHRRAGLEHAEAMALRRAGARARGATLYVTLEPCAHWGRTPPCADAIVRAGVRRVVVGLRDPHAIVNGRGLRRLRAGGVRVEVGLEAASVRDQLAAYRRAVVTGCPRVTWKVAASLDGRIADARGRSRWITGPVARRIGHELRAASDAIVIGARTARLDDPRLTARGQAGSPQPLRVVCDTQLRLPARLRLFGRALAGGTVVACGRRAPAARQRALEARGVRVWRLASDRRGVSPRALARALVRHGRHEVLLEGGAALGTAWLRAGLVSRLAWFGAPRLLGAAGRPWLADGGHSLAAAPRARILSAGRAGGDLWAMLELEGR